MVFPGRTSKNNRDTIEKFHLNRYAQLGMLISEETNVRPGAYPPPS